MIKYKSKFPHSKSKDPRKRFLFFLKALILLSPIPFGCVGKVWAPLFYVLVLILTFMGIKVIEEQNGFKVQGSKFKVDNPNNILYEKWIKALFIAILVFIGLQLIPLPIFLVKLISPKKIEVLAQLWDELPTFTPLSLVPFETLIYGLIVVLYGLFFWILTRIPLKKREMVGLFNILIICATVQVVLGLLKYAQGNTHFFLFFTPVEKSEFSRFLTGTLVNPNHFAFFLEMVLPLALGLFFYRLRFFRTDISFKQRVFSLLDENKIVMIYFISVVLMGIGVFLTGSRAGIVTMIFLFVLFMLLSLYLKLSRSIRRKIIWILGIIFCLVLYIGIQDTINEFKRSPIAESGRLTRWPNTLHMAKDYLAAGVGLGTYRYSYFLYDEGSGKWSTHAHNDVLEILAEGGIIGAIFFYSLFVLIILSIIQKWKLRRHPDVKILGLGIIVSIFAVIFHSVFDFSLRIPSNMFLFMLVLALGIKIVNYKRSSM